MRIEQATADDLPELADLLAILFEQEAEFQPETAAQARGLAHILDDADIGTIFVAKQDGAVVGMVSLLYTVSTVLGARVAMLEDMVVAPVARAIGIGSHLLQTAIEHARSTGCKRITLLTDRENEKAQRFYGNHGFRESGMLPMRLPL